MASTYGREFQIELLFDKRTDGIYHIHSESLPGLHLAGSDFDALRRDIEPVVRDLLFHNKNIVAEDIRWVPSLDDIQDDMTTPPSEARRATYVVKTGRAA